LGADRSKRQPSFRTIKNSVRTHAADTRIPRAQVARSPIIRAVTAMLSGCVCISMRCCFALHVIDKLTNSGPRVYWWCEQKKKKTETETPRRQWQGGRCISGFCPGCAQLLLRPPVMMAMGRRLLLACSLARLPQARCVSGPRTHSLTQNAAHHGMTLLAVSVCAPRTDHNHPHLLARWWRGFALLLATLKEATSLKERCYRRSTQRLPLSVSGARLLRK
jgi:hypothetical protein